jgi:heme exporter protein A
MGASVSNDLPPRLRLALCGLMDLTVTDLACARGGVTVLEGITLTLPAGRALVLRGPNGIGKTTRENLAFWAAVHGQRGVDAALDAMNLTVLQDRLAQHLSAGQKRRLGLARLLVTGRPVWLLDEPTVSLDAASVALFAGVVRAHLAAGGSALIATHVDLGLDEAALLDLSAFRAQSRSHGGAFDEAFA